MGLWREEMTIVAPVPPEVLEGRLAPHVSPERQFRLFKGPSFWGSFSHQGFELRRNTASNQGLRPTARGVFQTHAQGTNVVVFFEASQFAIGVMMAVVVLFVLLAVGGFVGLLALDAPNPWLPPLVVLAVALMIATMMWLQFKAAVGHTRREISQMLEGRPPS